MSRKRIEVGINVDNVNSPKHYKMECGIEVIGLIREVLGEEGFIAYCLGNILKYLFRAENKNGKEDYKKASKYLEFIIENPNADNFEISKIVDAEDLEKSLNISWESIISEIAKDLDIKEAFKLDAVFRRTFSENFEKAKEILDDFIKEYEEA